MNRHGLKRAFVATGVSVSAMGLAACFGGGGGDDVVVNPPTPPPPAPKLEDGFGAGFAAAFRAADTAEPRDPAAADIIPVNATADPVAIP